MFKVDWVKKQCSCDGYNFEWSEPHFDVIKGRYRCSLYERIPSHGTAPKDRFQTELSFAKNEYSTEVFQLRIVHEVLQAVHTLKTKNAESPSLGDYLFSEAKWNDIRKFFGWSTDTATYYKATLRNVFGDVLLLPMDKVSTEDIECAVNKKFAHRKYKASTIRAWLKIINRIFVYLQVACPGIRNPVRMDGRKIRETQREQKKAIVEGRISQKSLNDEQARTMFYAFLADIKRGEYLGVCGINMLENGRRPIEACSTTLGMHVAPPGETFLSAPVYEVVDGTIIDKHKNGRSIRKIPDSPVLEQVFEYYYLQVMIKLSESNYNSIDWRTVPFGGRFVYDKQGNLTAIKPFSSRDISSYVRKKLNECGINFSVVVEDTDEDSDDNRRAYSLRYTALSNLFCFLRRDVYQYIAAHRRSTSETGREENQARERYYLAPQVQREIYEGMKKMNEAIYGSDIVDEIRSFLSLSADS